MGQDFLRQTADGRRQTAEAGRQHRARGWRLLCLLPSAVCLLSCAKPPATPPPTALPPVVQKAPAADRRTLAREALALFDKSEYDEAVPALANAAQAYPEV